MTQRSEARLDSGAMRQIERWDIAPQASSIIALIPAYNEERFIGSLVLNVQQFVDQVVVVDDGSADQTAQIARRAGAMVLRHQANSGKAAAVNTGFNYLRQLGPAEPPVVERARHQDASATEADQRADVLRIAHAAGGVEMRGG